MARHLIDKRVSTSDPRDVRRFGQFHAKWAGAPHPAIRRIYRNTRQEGSRRLEEYLRIARGRVT